MGLSAGPFPRECPDQPLGQSAVPALNPCPLLAGLGTLPTDARPHAAVHQLIHMGAALPVAWRCSYGRRGRPQAEDRAFFPAPAGLLARASLQKRPAPSAP